MCDYLSAIMMSLFTIVLALTRPKKCPLYGVVAGPLFRSFCHHGDMFQTFNFVAARLRVVQ